MTRFQRYLIGKLGWYLAAFIIALALNFFLPRLVPGSPVNGIIASMSGGMSGEATKTMYATFVKEFGLDKPILQQFLTYLNDLAHGNMGTSFGYFPTKVSTLIGNALPWTIALQLPTIIIGWIIGNVLGLLAAYRGGWFDKGAFVSSLLLSSLPYYCLAILLLYALGVALPIFPSTGGYGFGGTPGLNFTFILDAAQHYILPFLSLVLVLIGGQAVGMRSMTIYELGADYVNYERGLGVNDNRIARGIFRNAVLPQVTGLALSIGGLVGGALITEVVFSYPGIGTTLFTAIRQADYPTIQGITLIVTVAVLGANLIVDLLYGVIDPRVRAAQQGER